MPSVPDAEFSSINKGLLYSDFEALEVVFLILCIWNTKKIWK